MRSAADRLDVAVTIGLLTLVVGGYLAFALLAEAFGCGHDGNLSEARCESDEAATGVLATVGPVVWFVAATWSWRARRWTPLAAGLVAVLALAWIAGYLPGMRHAF